MMQRRSTGTRSVTLGHASIVLLRQHAERLLLTHRGALKTVAAALSKREVLFAPEVRRAAVEGSFTLGRIAASVPRGWPPTDAFAAHVSEHPHPHDTDHGRLLRRPALAALAKRQEKHA
jgi:hypothetical protein